jgi:DNA (cytosine-5)-methyltransferase 1
MKTHLDLFSGIGGFAIAAQACGYTTIGFCEKEPYAQQILKERFGAVLADAAESGREANRTCAKRNGSELEAVVCRSPRLHDDIFTLNGADYAGVDLLTGGFPCQPFSVAGKRKGAADERALWPEMLRVIDGAKPAWIIGENVAGIVTMELDNILSDLEGIGYAAWPLVIPACAVDARHRRDRVWIVAHARHLRGRGRAESAGQERAEIANSGAKLADSQGAGLERREQQGTQLESELGLGQSGSCPRRQLPGGWREVVFAAECDPEGDGLCPCGFDYSDGCSQPGPTQDGYEYIERDGVLYGRPEETKAQWLPEPELGRVAHGIPNRAHRLRGLGNAIVPQVAYEIIRAIPPHIPGREIALAPGAGMR